MELMHHVGENGNQLVVIAADGDREIARFHYAELDQFIADHRLSVAELFDHTPAGQASLTRRLALLACARECRHGMTCLAFDCPHHPQRCGQQRQATG